MNPVILRLLPIIATVFIGVGQNVVKGNKKIFLAVAAYFALKWVADRAAIEKAKDELQVEIDPVTGNPTNPTYANPQEIAKAYRKAFDPLGTGWISWNGTNTDSVYELAGKAVAWSAVKSAYTNLYKSELETDLEGELSSSELSTFYGILGKRRNS